MEFLPPHPLPPSPCQMREIDSWIYLCSLTLSQPTSHVKSKIQFAVFLMGSTYSYYHSMYCSRKYPQPSHGRFFGLNLPHPSGNSHFGSQFPFKKFSFSRSPSPVEFPKTLLRVSMDIFWNHSMYLFSQPISTWHCDIYLLLIRSVTNFYKPAPQQICGLFPEARNQEG